MNERIFSSNETYCIAGITYRQLDHWCTKDVFGDHVKYVQSGNSREFTLCDVIVAYVVGVFHRDLTELDGRKSVALGANTALYRKIADKVREIGLRDTYVVVFGNSRLTIEVDSTELMSRYHDLCQTETTAAIDKIEEVFQLD